MIRVEQDQSAWKLRIILLILALIPLYAVQVVAPNVAQAVTAPSNCNTNPSANSLRVSPAHGQVLYIDSGSSTKVDASYVGYRVNYSGSGSKTVWVQLSNFTGGKVTLSNPLDAAQSLVSIASSDTKTAYFLLKATGATLSAQSHLVTIFDRRPDLDGATTLLTCSFTFLQVQETIKASANKINTVTGTLSPTAATLGGTLTVAVTSAGVGKVGGGKSPDFSLFWISPAAVSSWPTQSLRLESVSITFNCTSGSTIGNSSFTVTNTLSLSNAAAYCYSNNSQTNSWTSSYVFRIIGPGPSSLTPSPIAMIASGTQYKHSDINALSFSSAINLSTVSTAAFTIKVRAVAETQTASLSYVRYTITESTTANTLVNVDELIDKIAAGVTYQSGSTKLTNSVSTNTVIPDPTTIASDPSPPPLHFIGPFSVISGTNTVVSYLVALPCSASAASYQNVVTAKIGSQTLGITGTLSSASTVSVSTVLSGGNCSSTVTNDQTINLSPTAQTQPATALSASGTSASATLNGYGTGYGLSGVTAQFRYSTDPNLINGASLTTSQAITGSGPNALTANLTGLSVNTIYYFRAEVTSSAGTITGVTLSFLTPDVLSAPTVITNAVTNLSGTSVTLNGYINPHLNTVTPITFEYCLYAAGTCDATHIPASPTVLNVATDSVATNGTVSSIDLSLSGSGDYYFNSDDISGASRVTSLTAGGTYFYQARATCANTVTTVCTSTSISFTGGIKQFTVGAPIVVTSPATVIGPNSAIINGTFSANGSSTPQYYFNYCQAGVSTCSATSVSGSGVDSTTARSQSGNLVAVSETVTALQGVTLTPNTLYYFQILGVTGGSVKAYGDILPFTTLGIVTTSLPSGPVNSPYSASIVGGGGSGSYTFSTASTLAAGLTLSSEGVLSGTPTVAGDYSITVTVTDQVHGTTYSKNFTYSIVGVTTTAATSIAQVTATINGTSANNLSNPQFCFSSSNPGSTFTYGSGTCAAPINASGSYLANVTGLSSSTSYYFQLFGVVNGTRYSGAVLTFVTLPPYTITVNAGTGGTAGSSASSFLSGGSANLTATPSLGYNFTSWSCSGATVTTTTSNPATLSSPTGNVICTANFSPISYNITYNLQGGNISGSTTNPQSSVPYNSNALSAPHKPNNPTQTGYSFIGWNTSAKMGSKIDTFTVSGAATLYAQWSPDTLTVTFHINNGSGTETSTQSFYFDVAGSLNAKPSGWTNSSAANFLGWNTSSGASTATYSDSGTATFTSATDLYAIWSSSLSWSITANPKTFTTGSSPETLTATVSPSGGLSGVLTCDVYALSDPGFASPLTYSSALAPGTYIIRCTGSANAGYAPPTVVTANLTVLALPRSITYHSTTSSGGNASGGFAPVDPNSPYGDSSIVTLLGNSGSLSLTGYNFAGWCTTSNNSSSDTCTTGTLFYSGDTLTITSDIHMYSLWTPISYSITVNAGTGGSASSNHPTISRINQATVSATPSTGYTFGSWSCTNSTISDTSTASTTISMPSGNVICTANFTAIPYLINYVLDGGQISNSPSPRSANVPFNSNALSNPHVPSNPSRSGYNFNGWNISPSAGSVIGSFIVTQSDTLTAQWSPIDYNLTVNAGSGGSAMSSSSTINVTTPANLLATPNSGYVFTSWSCSNSTLGNSASETSTVSAPLAHVVCEANFAPSSYTITASSGANGSISPSGATTVAYGASQSFSMTPASGYQIASISIDGSSTSAVATYTFTNVSADHTISVTFTAQLAPPPAPPAPPAPPVIPPAPPEITVPDPPVAPPTPPVTKPGRPTLIQVPRPPSAPPVVVRPPVVTPAAPTSPALKPILQPDPAPTVTISTAIAAPGEQLTMRPISISTPTAEKPSLGVEISGNNWSISLTSTTQLQQGAVNESSPASVTIEKGNSVTSFGTGFKPLSQIDIYVFSTPQWLGSTLADAAGNYTVTLAMPPSLPSGDHIFQAQGITFDDIVRTANVPILLIPASIAKPAELKFSVYFALDKYYLDGKARKTITSAAAKVRGSVTKNSQITIRVTGWVQPRGGKSNDLSLAKNRAVTVANALRKLELDVRFTITAQGRDKPDAAKSRRTDVVISWSNATLKN